MSDWEVVSDNQQQSSTSNKSDWGVVPYDSQEESYWKSIPRDVLIGLTHAGRNLHNLPHDLVQFGDVVGSKIGRAFGAQELQDKDSSLASYLPYDEADYSDVLGQKGRPSGLHKIIQKGTEYAPDIIGGLNALRSMKLLPHLTKYGASKKLNKAQKLAQERDIGKMNINPELIEDVKQFLPNILRNRQALDASHTGDYNSLFRLQSDVGKISQARMGKIRSLFAPESAIKGRAGLESRGKLLNAIREDLSSQGHHDIADLMKKGQDEYRRYMKFKPYRNRVAGAAALYALPKNALIDLAQKLYFHRGE